MNIHFDNIELFEKLKNATIAKVRVGSYVYGTNDEHSDEDFLYIYATSNDELFSPIKTHHQLQFIESGKDHNFVSLHNFVSNILSGDSTINYEVLFSDELIGTELEWFLEYKNIFTSYTMIKSYLGICRRDIRHFNRCKTDRIKKKRLGHIIRGYLYSRSMIYQDEFDFIECNKELLSIDIDITNSKMLREYTIKVDHLRKEMNKLFESKKLNVPTKIELVKGQEFNKRFVEFCKSDYFKSKQLDMETDVFVNAFENWVSY